MKKLSAIFVLLLLSLSLFPASWSEAVNRGFTIQGAYGDVVKVKFTKIPTQSSAFSSGMPFDIESELVQYNVMKDGREISYWSLISNTNFELSVTATQLESKNTYVDSLGKYLEPAGTEGKTKLDYILKFTYEFGYIENSKQQTSTGYFTINTGTGTATSAKPGSGETTVTAENGVYTINLMPSSTSTISTIGTVDGSVYFMFTSEATNRIQNYPDTVIDGDYTATVTITITKK